MPNVFIYSDYRIFLADYYAEKKRQTPSFSYQNFSRKAGFVSKSFVYNVINGRKNLSRTSVLGMNEALGLSGAAAEYFQNLVFFNQAPTYKERQFYFERLSSVRTPGTEASRARRIRQDQYEFYSTWYHAVVRSLIDLFPFKDDFRGLASMLRPTVKAPLVRRSVRLLERLGFVEIKPDGFYRVTSKLLTTGKEVQSVAVQRFHLEALRLAQEALRSLPRSERNITGLTLGISRATYEQICDLINTTHERILEMAEKDTKADNVYQLNVQLFPVSKTNGKRGAP
jgi:uncharacterized protein (TIGR02147 family)